MENTIENKAKFFAQYWEQKYVYETEYGKHADSVGGFHFTSHLKNELMNLQLKPLSAISDEDAIEAAEMLFDGENYDEIQIFRQPNNQETIELLMCDGFGENSEIEKTASIWIEDSEIIFDDNSSNSLAFLYAYDFLRSKGYLLPFNGLSTEQIIAYGWVKTA